MARSFFFFVVVAAAAALICLALLIAGIVFIVRFSRRKNRSLPPLVQPPLAQAAPVTRTVELKKCPQCHLPLDPNAPEGLCPSCLAKAALGSEPAVPGTRVPPAPGALAEQFPQLEILELLGMGGMGMVYKARQPRLDRLVALKILPIASMPDASFAERFEREAKALARLNHHGIVTLHDFGQTKEYYYFVMEFVDGLNLRQLIQSKTLEPRQALELVMQICTALQFAHDENIVHRDIKPENILITKRGNVKIADFGLAKLLGGQPDTSLTASQMVMGTINYMAPEQRENTRDVDHRADIYSLGVVFYEMLTGEVPMGRFEPPSKKVQVDVRLDEVVLHALEREPARRYQHISEVKSNVETISSSMPREVPKEKSSRGLPRTFKPQPQPAFVPFVLKWFVITGGAWLAVGLWLHWMLGDAQMTMTFKDNVWSWSLGNWAVTFPSSDGVPVYYNILGAVASLFYLGLAWIALPAIFILVIIAWLDAIAKCGLKYRQLPPSTRRRYWWWQVAINGVYIILALTTVHFFLTSGHVRTTSMLEYQQVSDQATEWWFVPNSGAYEKLGFKAEFIDNQEPAPADGLSPLPACTLSLILHRTNAEPAVMKVILPGLRANYRFPVTNNWDNSFVLDKDSVDTWLHSAGGVDLSVPKAHAEADQIYQLLKAYESVPPQTVKEFVNLAKADLRDFWFSGMEGGTFNFGMTDQSNGILFLALIGGESLIGLALYFWATRRLYGEALAEIEAGRWTPQAVITNRFPAAIKVLVGLLFASLAASLASVFSNQRDVCDAMLVVYLSLGILLIVVLQLHSRRQIELARKKGLWPQMGELPTLEHVKRLAHAGEKILAIKLYRQIHGVSLADARSMVEKLAGS